MQAPQDFQADLQNGRAVLLLFLMLLVRENLIKHQDI